MKTAVILASLVVLSAPLYADTALDILKKAHRGDVVSMRKIGYMKFSGKGTSLDRKNGLAWLKKAAEKDDTQAMYYLGIIYAEGSYVGQDMVTAKRYMLKAAAKGHEKAKKKMAEYFPTEAAASEYEDGLVCEKSHNYSKAFGHFKAAAELGHAKAQSSLAFCYMRGQGTEENETKAIKWFIKSAEQDAKDDPKTVLAPLKKAADKGDMQAMYYLGRIYAEDTYKGQNMEESKRYMLKAAGKGHEKAKKKMVELFPVEAAGDAYEDGLVCEASYNYSEAFGHYKTAAELGHADAQLSLGSCYANGRGTEKNVTEAFKWIRKSAEQGNDEAQYALGELYFNGIGVARNVAEAEKWFRAAAKQGHEKAAEMLNERAENNLTERLPNDTGDEEYKKGLACEKVNNWSEAFRHFKVAAEQGNAAAQHCLASYYLMGQGTEKNETEAFEWFKKSADQGYADAQCLLAGLYALGQGTEEDETEAFEWYKKSADQGNANAQYWLASFYMLGRGTEKNYTEAFEWFKKSADQGYAEAQCLLGEFYMIGRSTEKNEILAFEWYKKSAAQGYARAQYLLARSCYVNGRGTEKNAPEAFKWFKSAAEQGYDEAQYELGRFYLNGIAVPKDAAEAKKWFREAAKQGHEKAAEMLNVL